MQLQNTYITYHVKDLCFKLNLFKLMLIFAPATAIRFILLAHSIDLKESSIRLWFMKIKWNTPKWAGAQIFWIQIRLREKRKYSAWKEAREEN